MKWHNTRLEWFDKRELNIAWFEDGDQIICSWWVKKYIWSVERLLSLTRPLATQQSTAERVVCLEQELIAKQLAATACSWPCWPVIVLISSKGHSVRVVIDSSWQVDRYNPVRHSLDVRLSVLLQAIYRAISPMRCPVANSSLIITDELVVVLNNRQQFIAINRRTEQNTSMYITFLEISLKLMLKARWHSLYLQDKSNLRCFNLITVPSPLDNYRLQK